MIHFSQYFKSSSNFKSFRNWSWNLHPLTHDPNNFIFNHLDFFVYYNPTLRIEFTFQQYFNISNRPIKLSTLLFNPSNPSKLDLTRFQKNHQRDNPKPRHKSFPHPPSFRLIQPYLRKTFSPSFSFDWFVSRRSQPPSFISWDHKTDREKGERGSAKSLLPRPWLLESSSLLARRNQGK